MLKITPLELWQEITKAKELAKKVNESREEMIRAYVGTMYRSDWAPATTAMNDNRFDEWLRLVLPQIVFDNPKVRVTTNRSGVHPAVPMAMQAGLNWWAPQARLAQVLVDVAYDAAFTYGVVLTTHGPRPGGESWRSDRDEQAMAAMPRVSRIAPDRWFCDHGTDRYDPASGQGRYAGHIFRADKEDLLADKRFNASVVSGCVTGSGQDNYGGEKTDREEIFGYEVWIPEIKTSDDPDACGTIYCLGLDQSMGTSNNAAWLRDPRPYIGPACGPYTLFGFGLVPGSPYPFSPFAAAWAQVKNLNEHLDAADRSASRKKRFVIVDAENTQAATTLRQVRDGEVATMRDFKNTMIEVQLGGVTADQVEHNRRLGEQVDRSLNLSETARGNVNVDTSATAIADAASQRSARLASMKRLMVEGAAQVLRTAAWHLYTHEDAVFSLPHDVAESFITRPSDLPDPSQAEPMALATGVDVQSMRRILEHRPEVIYGGGPADEVITQAISEEGTPVYVVSPNVRGTRFEDFELEIEPYSMERVDEALLQRRSMQVFQVITGALPLIAQYPQLKWEELIDMIGQPMNLPNLAEQTLGRAWLSQLRAQADGLINPGMAPAPGMGAPGMGPAPAGVPQVRASGGDGADGMSGRIGESVYGGGNLARAAAV